MFNANDVAPGLGDRLRQERCRLKLTHAQYGKLGGVSGNIQLDYENGKRNPDSDYFIGVALGGSDIGFLIKGCLPNRNNKPLDILDETKLSASEHLLLFLLREFKVPKEKVLGEMANVLKIMATSSAKHDNKDMTVRLLKHASHYDILQDKLKTELSKDIPFSQAITCSAETHEPLDTSLSSIPYPMESSIPPTFAASAALRPFGKARD